MPFSLKFSKISVSTLESVRYHLRLSCININRFAELTQGGTVGIPRLKISIAARQELIDARLAYIDAARRAHLNRIELERLAGAALTAADGDAITEHKDDNHDH